MSTKRCCDNESCRLGVGDPRHGTENGYGNLRCRCQPCRDAHAEEYRTGVLSRSLAKYRARLVAEGFRASGPTPRTTPFYPRPNARGPRLRVTPSSRP